MADNHALEKTFSISEFASLRKRVISHIQFQTIRNYFLVLLFFQLIYSIKKQHFATLFFTPCPDSITSRYLLNSTTKVASSSLPTNCSKCSALSIRPLHRNQRLGRQQRPRLPVLRSTAQLTYRPQPRRPLQTTSKLSSVPMSRTVKN